MSCNKIADTRSLKILIISSESPSASAGIGDDIINSLKDAGHRVDYLTRFKVAGSKSEVKYIYDIPVKLKKRIKNHIKIFNGPIPAPFWFRKRFRRFAEKIISIKNRKKRTSCTPSKYPSANGVLIYHPDETKPDVEIASVLDKIDDSYDLVITFYWHYMINSSTLAAVYDKLKVPIIIYAPDMSPITGGCYYFSTCKRYTSECGRCPAYGGSNPNDATHINYLVKKRNYTGRPIVFGGNQWMCDRARESKLFADDKIQNIGIVINETLFVPFDKIRAKKRLGLSTKKFTVLLRSSHDGRKGNSFFIEAIKQLLANGQITKDEIRIVSIGDHTVETGLDGTIRVKNLRHVQQDKLIKAYQAADVFISTSTDDAGPSMINQSLMCGTPVISFKTGVAPEVIKDGENGFLCETGNTDQLAEAIMKAKHCIFDKRDNSFSDKAREIALKQNSRQKIADSIISIYKQLSNRD